MKESQFTSDIFLPYLSPSCPYACCNPPLRRSYYPAMTKYQMPRYSMPISAPVNYQIVPIRHSNSLYRTPTKSLQNLDSFASHRTVDDNNNTGLRHGTLLRMTEDRKSPYYYNELTQSHATNATNQQFSPIANSSRIDETPNHFSSTHDEKFCEFISTINPEVFSS